MSRNSYYKPYGVSDGEYFWGLIAVIIIALIVCAFCDEIHVSSERQSNNMIWIEEGYCYDADTKIIYREVIIDGRYNDTPTYSPYINENGNYCKYQNGKWVEFIK